MRDSSAHHSDPSGTEAARAIRQRCATVTDTGALLDQNAAMTAQPKLAMHSPWTVVAADYGRLCVLLVHRHFSISLPH
jgi:hypothetical protein